MSRKEEVLALAEEVVDRFGRLPPSATRLLQKTLLGIAGRRAGVDTILVRGGRARVNFLPDVVPRMSGLETALKGRQVEFEVRRIAPLSLVMQCTQRQRLVSLIVRCVDALGGHDPGSDDEGRSGNPGGAVESAFTAVL